MTESFHLAFFNSHFSKIFQLPFFIGASEFVCEMLNDKLMKTDKWYLIDTEKGPE